MPRPSGGGGGAGGGRGGGGGGAPPGGGGGTGTNGPRQGSVGAEPLCLPCPGIPSPPPIASLPPGRAGGWGWGEARRGVIPNGATLGRRAVRAVGPSPLGGRRLDQGGG